MEAEPTWSEDVVCPYCGHVICDAWELEWRDGTIITTNCGHCGKEARVTLRTTHEYLCERPAPPKEGTDQNG